DTVRDRQAEQAEGSELQDLQAREAGPSESEQHYSLATQPIHDDAGQDGHLQGDEFPQTARQEDRSEQNLVPAQEGPLELEMRARHEAETRQSRRTASASSSPGPTDDFMHA